MSISIVIVNWNTGDMLRDCLRSISESDCIAAILREVIVVDNASTDESADGLAESTVPLKMISNTRNVGFGVACNQGATLATGEFTLFLNPDVRLYKNTLTHVLAFMSDSANAEVGICGVNLEDGGGNYTTSFAKFPTVRSIVGAAVGLRSEETIDIERGGCAQDVEQVIGAFFMIRTAIFRNLEGFDNRFFVYFEEVDLSLRAKKAGWRSVCLADVRAVHFGGGSSRQVKAKRLFYFLRSRMLYASKHFSTPGLTCVVIVTFTLEFVSRITQAALMRSSSQAVETMNAYSMLLHWLPKWQPMRTTR